MAKHFMEGRLPFKKGTCAAARAFYRKKVAAEHFKHFTYRTIYLHIFSYM